MKRAIREEWVKRLRSGDYEQGRGYLNKDGKFCCLGVLTEMAVEAGICQPVEAGICLPVDDEDGVIRYRAIGGDIGGFSGQLPPGARSWAGLTGDEQGALVELNDEKNFSFDVIADYIERAMKDDAE